MYSYQARGNPFAYRKPMVKKIPVTVTLVTAEQVWAFAATADRINDGQYLKEDQWNTSTAAHFKSKEANKNMLRRWLREGYCGEDTAEDREQGLAARAWHRGQLLMTALKRPLSGFEETLNRAVGLDEFALEINQLEIAIVASQIRTYRTGVEHEKRMWGTDTSPVAAVGTKVECQVEVVKLVYSQNYNTNYVRAVTVDTRKVVMFTYREGWDVGTILTIRGTVKAHREDCTQLNRVKVL
jgi:hypothetical protein